MLEHAESIMPGGLSMQRMSRLSSMQSMQSMSKISKRQ